MGKGELDMEEIVRSLDFALGSFEEAIDTTYSKWIDRAALRDARKSLDKLDPEKKWRLGK